MMDEVIEAAKTGDFGQVRSLLEQVQKPFEQLTNEKGQE